MKLKKILSLVSLFTIIILSGCDSIDSLDTFPLNVPLSIELRLEGNYTSITKSGGICLDTSATYKKYKDKIKTITFIEAAFRTKSVNPSTLSGNVTLALANGSGNTLFTKNLGNIKPSDYAVTPYKLSLTQVEINAINAYMAITGNQCFTATVNATGLPGGNDQALVIDIDLVFQADTEF